jgi:hypothetical protein
MWNVLKYDKKSGAFSFMWSPDFATADEPCILESCMVVGSKVATRSFNYDNPLIYHHKFLFVPEDTMLFDFKQSMLRSVEWSQKMVGVNRSKIGYRKQWLKALEEHGL